MAYQTTTTGTRALSFGARLILTIIGAAAMIVGAFLDWTGGMAGTGLTNKSLWSRSMTAAATFLTSAGAVMIVLGLLALLGMAAGTGWLTRLAGALGVIAFALFAIEVYRIASGAAVQIGAWVSLAGSIVVLLAGILGSRKTTVTTVSTPPAAPTN
jgi:hypothetical protein